MQIKTCNIHPKEDAHFETLAQVFKALGHPARLKMVAALAQKECCVCELTELVELDMSTVSRHLNFLKSCNIVKSKRKGTWMHYTLALKCLSDVLQCLQTKEEKK